MKTGVKEKTVVMIQREESIDAILKSAKGDILKEFEKVCPTDMSFQRIKKDVHDIFDGVSEKINNR